MGKMRVSKGIIVLGIVCIFIFQYCSHPTPKPDASSPSGNPAEHNPSVLTLCGLEGFTQSPAEHIINDIEAPFVVREIRGRTLNQTGQRWWKDIRVLVEIRKKDGGVVRKTYADDNGDFIVKDVSEGQYCFKATVLGWQSVMGIIIVSKKADPKNKIVFEMRLGV